MAEAFDAGEDLVGGFGPDKRFGIVVGLVNIGLNRDFEAVGADKYAALEAAAGQDGEPALYQVEP